MLSLNPELLKQIDKHVTAGEYDTREQVIAAAIASLDQQQSLSDFAPGELSKLLAVADEEIDRGEVLDGEEVFREIRNLGNGNTGNLQ